MAVDQEDVTAALKVFSDCLVGLKAGDYVTLPPGKSYIVEEHHGQGNNIKNTITITYVFKEVEPYVYKEV